MIDTLIRTGRLSLALALLLTAAAYVATPAQADEIEIQDLETCEVKRISVFEIASEDQSKLLYRTRKNGDLIELPTAAVRRVMRGDANDKEAARIDEARSEIRNGNYDAALATLREVHGGGYYTDLETQDRVFTPYTNADPSGRNKRPRWQSEYAHYFALQALYRKAEAEQSREVYEEALVGLVDSKVQIVEEKADGTRSRKSAQSGGFLNRFEGGTSRWYPAAKLLHAHVLRGLGKHDEATKAYNELYEIAVREKLHPRYAYQASLGAGLIAEAKKDLRGAIQQYNAAGIKLMQLLDVENRACLRLALGRFYSQSRVNAVRVQLADAEASGGNKAKFRQLRSFIEQGSPEALRKRYGTKSRPVREAIVSGARSAEVQAVALTGMGRAYMIEGKLEAAMLAFKEVAVKHFKLRNQAAQATSYLAKAAADAAKDAKGETRKLYESWRDQARQALKTTYRDTEWGRK